MKTLLLPLAIAILVSSCIREPEACFDVGKQVYSRNQSIQFFNCSHRAERVEWDFGDGKTSTEYAPTHRYDNPGNYTAVLRGYNKAGEDDFTFNISIGRYAIKSFHVDSISDTITYPRIKVDEYASLSDSIHGWAYMKGYGTDCLNLNVQGGYNLTEPNLILIHIYDIFKSESNLLYPVRIVDTLHIDSNVIVNLDHTRKYDDVLFFGKTETLKVDLEYELIVPNF